MASFSYNPNKVSSQLSLPPLQQTSSRPSTPYVPPPSPTILINNDDPNSSEGRKASIADQAFDRKSSLADHPPFAPGIAEGVVEGTLDLLPPSQQQILRKVSAPLPVIPSICCSSMPRKSSAPCTGTTSSGQQHLQQQMQHQQRQLQPASHLPLSGTPSRCSHHQQTPSAPAAGGQTTVHLLSAPSTLLARHNNHKSDGVNKLQVDGKLDL